MACAYLALVAGLVFAVGGGELFVRGTVGIARTARVSPGIIAVTVAAFATSSPELTVADSAAIEGSPQISLGDALGSNVVNVALILGLVLLIAPLTVPPHIKKRDFPVAMLVPAIAAAMLFDGELSRTDGFLLLASFSAWLAANIADVRTQRSATGEVIGDPNTRRAAIESFVGLALLVASGVLIVSGASSIASQSGISKFAIGATAVAIGTSVPELATAVIARIKGHDDVGLGTILGSNIFNGLFIAGTAAVITPYRIGVSEVAPAVLLGAASVALIWPYGRLVRALSDIGAEAYSWRFMSSIS